MSKPPPKRRLRWAKSYRVVNSRFPPIDVFERIADPEDWESLIELEMLTNPRVRQDVGEISLVPVEERVSGPGASWLMAPFTHIGWPSRFSDGTWGVYYCARSLLTAVHEKAHHVGIFFAQTKEPLGTTMELRALVASVDARFHDVRGGFRKTHHPVDYSAAQALARSLREAGSNGVAYDSVRHLFGSVSTEGREHANARAKSAIPLRWGTYRSLVSLRRKALAGARAPSKAFFLTDPGHPCVRGAGQQPNLRASEFEHKSLSKSKYADSIVERRKRRG